jgi:thiol-disulfide isomerase/thioredoxin
VISRKGQLAAIGAALVIAGAAIYLTGGGQGNGTDATCAETAARAAALDSLVGGEVAAFQLGGEPANLSGLAFTGADGAPKTLADFSGKVALVNLWATWCGPCRKEMPALDRLQAAMGGPDFDVVPVSIDTGDPELPAEFLESVGVKNLPLYRDPSTEIFQELKRRGLALGLPVTLLLDRNGCRLGHMNGPAEWDSEDGRELIQAAIDGSRPAS